MRKRLQGFACAVALAGVLLALPGKAHAWDNCDYVLQQTLADLQYALYQDLISDFQYEVAWNIAMQIWFDRVHCQ